MRTVEYEFILPDGSKRYELIDLDNEMSIMRQIELCKKLHGAVKAHPVRPTLFDDPALLAGFFFGLQ